MNAAEKAQKAKARTGGGGSRLASTQEQQQREEAECFSALLLLEKEYEGGCSSTAVENDAVIEESHLTAGLFRLCEEWDVSGALDHFLAATARNRRRGSSLGKQEKGKEEDRERKAPHNNSPEWGAVWLAQASFFTTYVE